NKRARKGLSPCLFCERKRTILRAKRAGGNENHSQLGARKNPRFPVGLCCAADLLPVSQQLIQLNKVKAKRPIDLSCNPLKSENYLYRFNGRQTFACIALCCVQPGHGRVVGARQSIEDVVYVLLVHGVSPFVRGRDQSTSRSIVAAAGLFLICSMRRTTNSPNSPFRSSSCSLARILSSSSGWYAS